jgi:hypothetical protein
MGACTAVIQKVYIIGDRKEVIADVTMSSSYATGGDTCPQTLLGLDLEQNIVDVCGRAFNGTLAFDAHYNHATSKMLLFGTSGTPGAAVGDPEVTAGTNVAAYVVRVRAIGKGPAA